jgi:hypothetical protein
MLHKIQFSALVYEAVVNRWASQNVISIEQKTYLTASVFVSAMEAYLNAENQNLKVYDRSEIKKITFEDSIINLTPMDPYTLMSLLLDEM